MVTRWEPASVKVQLRLTSQRLGQLQEKKDSQGNITRRDIATLLQQRNIGLARAKAQNLIQEDALSDLLEILEMHTGLILEHFNELDQNVPPSPVVVEAASSIIFAAPQVESKDLGIVRDLLIQRLGPDFARSANGNRDNHVSARVVQALSAPPPSAANLDLSLHKIAHSYGVKWSPEPRRQDILNLLSEILDPEALPLVDLSRLRKLCSHGIPDEPAWLRPRIWKLLFGTLPVLKASWRSEITKQRESYYDLIRQLLEPIHHLPDPTSPLAPSDITLINVHKQLSRVPPSLFSALEDEPELYDLCPLNDKARDDIKLACAGTLDSRLKTLQQHRDSQSLPSSITPEIHLEPDGIPEISLSTPDGTPADEQSKPTTLLSSKTVKLGYAHHRHSTSLLRLLYLHTSINPGSLSPHIPSLLVPLYSALNQEIEQDDATHVEADTFWLFEAMVGEFSELEDEEGGNIWMKKFSERLAWADVELSDSLCAKGLDPALPHYSYRWLAPLLTHTLPLSCIYIIWDTLFAREMRNRDANPKLDYLLDICTGMLIRARAALFRLGKGGKRSLGLWVEEGDDIRPSSPLPAWDLGDAFLEGMSLLQMYPIETAGGIDRILQTASDLAQRREDESKATQGDKLSLGARLKVTMWKGFTNQVSSPEKSPVEPETSDDDGNDTETPEGSDLPGITSRLATTVWRGITNQTSMEAPPSPVYPLSPVQSRSPSPLPTHQQTDLGDGQTRDTATSLPAQAPSTIWGYAEKFKDSDAAATLAKVSSNWRAKALLGSWSLRGGNSADISGSLEPPKAVRSGSVRGDNGLAPGIRRGSLPGMDRSGVYSPPAPPAFFRSPRNSLIIPSNKSTTSSPDQSPLADGGLLHKTKSLQSTLASLTRTPTHQPPPKSGPRPLLLNSSTLITAPSRDHGSSQSLSLGQTERGQWADVMRGKVHGLHRDSMSSVSSLSPSDALSRPLKSNRSDWDSDTGGPSRLVPLNRRSVSPMAPKFKAPHTRTKSGSESTSSERGILSPPLPVPPIPNNFKTLSRGWGHVEILNFPPLTSPPKTPASIPSHTNGIVRVTDPEQHRGSVVLEDTNYQALEPPLHARKLVRKKTPPPSQYQADDTSDSSIAGVPSRSPRARSKRYPARLTKLYIQENSRSLTVAEQQRTPSPNSLVVDWPREDQDTVMTPRASNFDVDQVPSTSPTSMRPLRRSRKVSGDGQERINKAFTEGHEVRARKISTDSRTRKVSADSKEAMRRTRDSAAEEGDDEGYDDLLSAYESEEGSLETSLR